MLRMFKRKGTIIAEGLKIVGSVTAEGLVEVNGHIEGDLHCTSLVISPKASISGGVEAERVVVNGRVEGPIRGGEVLLKSHAHVVGDIQHQSLAIERGAFFDGRSVRAATPMCASSRRRGRSSLPRGCGARPRRTGGSPRLRLPRKARLLKGPALLVPVLFFCPGRPLVARNTPISAAWAPADFGLRQDGSPCMWTPGVNELHYGEKSLKVFADAPPLVQACLKSWRRCNPTWRVQSHQSLRVGRS